MERLKVRPDTGATECSRCHWTQFEGEPERHMSTCLNGGSNPMVMIAPDAEHRISECIVIIDLVRQTQIESLRNQHLARLERILEMLKGSITDA